MSNGQTAGAGRTPTIFLVDDDPAVLKAITRLLRSAALNVVAYASPEEFLECYRPDSSGCLVLDYSMPGLNGLQLQQALAAKGSLLPVIFLTGRGDIPTSVQAMKRGAIDFLTKPVDEDALLAVIRRAIEHNDADRQASAETADIQRRYQTLTPREREVFSYVISGWRNKRIADGIGTVEKTVKVHRARVMEKMQVHSVAELVRLAAQIGITPVP